MKSAESKNLGNANGNILPQRNEIIDKPEKSKTPLRNIILQINVLHALEFKLKRWYDVSDILIFLKRCFHYYCPRLARW